MRFCITGTGRCGTRLFREMLNAHPRLYVFNETHWIPKMFEFFGTGEADVDTLRDIVRRTYQVTGEPFTALDDVELAAALAGRTGMTVAEFCDVIGTSLAHEHGKTMWADKTPDYGPHLQMLQKLWPKCRVVHVIRHGRAVAMSMARHPGFRWMASAREMWWTPPSFNRYYRAVRTRRRPPLVDFVDLWYWRLLRIRDEATRLAPGSYMEVRFEDLLERPEAMLREIAAFVDVPAPEDWLIEAVDLIDLGRVHWRPDEIECAEFDTHHIELLNSLGYD